MLEGLPTGYSIGRAEGTSAGLCIFENETPDAANDDGPCVSGILAAPALTTPSGWYDAPLTVQVAFPNANQTVRYTTNGDVPTEASPAFPASGITTNESTVLSVRAYSNDGSELPSPVKDATFIVDEFAPILPTFSIITDYDNLWDWNTGIYVMGPNASEEYPHFGSNFWEPWSKLSRMQFFDANGVLQSEDKMDLEIHGGWSRAEPQRSFRLDFKNEYSGDFEWPIFSDKPWLNSFNNINLRNGGQHSWATKMQDGVIARLALNTHNMASSWEPSHVYLNGEYWGLYAAREKLDEHYIADNFGTESESVDLIGPFAVLNGSDADLQASANLMMSTPTGNSNFVSLFSERFDIENYMDYFIFETYAQNTDWMGIAWGLNNVKAFRPSPEEKWHYILYDTDAGFGFFGASVWDNFIQLARNPGYPNLHSDLFDRMLDNTEFRLRFINRYADLVNTLFQTNSFNDQVTEAMDAITSSMPYHIYRWNSPGSLTNWLNALNTLTQHNTNRIGTSRNHLMSSFGLPEDYECTLDVFPPLAGTVRVNTITPGPLPWDGVYFKDCPIEIEAYAEPGWMFDQWDMNAHIQSGAMNATDHANVISLHSNDLYRARFEPCPTDASVDLVLSGTLLQAETTGIPFIDSIEWSMNGEVLGSGMEWLPEWDGQYFASVYFDGCLVESGGFWTNGVDIADQVKEAPAATLYPNPANDHVLLTSFDRESDVKVFNAMGQWIWGGAALTARVQGTRGERIWDVDTSKWPEGTYFVHFGPLQVEKLIVHR